MTESPGPSRNAAIPDRARRGRLLRWALAPVALGVVLLGIGFALSSAGSDRVLPGVSMGGIDVSRLTRPEIVSRAQQWGAEREAKKLALSVAGTPLVFEPSAVGFAVDADASATRALLLGRADSAPRRAWKRILRSVHPEQIEVVFHFDPQRLSASMDGWEQQSIKDPPFSGGISVEGSTVSPAYPRSGTRLDRTAVESQLRDATRDASSVGSLKTRTEAPPVRPAEVDRVVAQAKAMSSGDVLLATADDAHRLQLTPAQVASVLFVAAPLDGKLELGCAPEAMHRLLDAHRSELEQAAQNAHFVVDAQDHVHVEPGHPGVVLDDQALAHALCTAAQSPDRKGDLPLSPGAEPALSTEAAEHAGIVGLMGTYTTRHACCQPRVQNIHHIADLLNDSLVVPGATFSVNQIVGPRTVKNGFRPAPSIEDGDMVDTVGGGVSQFATTLFNALFYGGYDILERQPHSYWFTRYPMGYDATLSYPHPDIVFKNDTDAGALIKTEYTDTTITVKVYGNNGGRRVRAEVSERQNIVSPPVELIPNPRLDADEEKTREGGEIGWTVTVKRIITFPDGKIKEERRKVTYKPRARRVEVHPCRIPEGQPGHTGERCPVPDKDSADPSAASDTGAK